MQRLINFLRTGSVAENLSIMLAFALSAVLIVGFCYGAAYVAYVLFYHISR